MKKFILLVLTIFALTAFAGEPVSTVSTNKSVTVSKVLSKKSKRQLKALSAVHTINNNDDDYGPPDSDDLDIHRAYSRPKLVVLSADNFGISAKVAARLKLARQLAMAKYQEIWCNGGVA